MFTPEDLAEVHRRTHCGTARLIEHCAQLTPEELRRDLSEQGYGINFVLGLAHHIIGAEQYWLAVLKGRLTPPFELTEQEAFDDEPENFPDMAALEAYRARIAQDTQDWLMAQTPESLNTPVERHVWGGALRSLNPAHVMFRIITHHHHHRGQVASMTRLLGYPPPPSPALDFPLVLEI